MRILEELVSRRSLLCPGTRAPAQVRDGRIVSPEGEDFGSAAGPLDLRPGHRESRSGGDVPPQDVERLRVQLELPQGEEVRAEVARAIAATGAQFQEDHLSAESRSLAARLRMPEFTAQPKSIISRLSGAVASAGMRFAPKRARLEGIGHTVGELLTAGRQVQRGVRVRNAGKSSIPAGTSIETRFTSPAGEPVAGTSLSTAVPVDLDAGRELTLILGWRAPEAAGSFRIEARLAGEATPFIAAPVLSIPCDLPVFEYAYHPEGLSYAADHHVAMLELEAFLAKRSPNGGVSILEIGGGIHPTGHALAQRGHRVVSADISHSQSILGALYFRTKMPELDERLAFVSCEGAVLPFADGAFEGVMLFAAFHHFADPVALLREAMRVTTPEGFIYLACDSCFPETSREDYLNDLRDGINEQIWTLPEFAAYFREAGLAVAQARIDHASLKVVLLKA
jgi:ubiquinone/menaquinone biosynthesis C-methylase UbiE